MKQKLNCKEYIKKNKFEGLRSFLFNRDLLSSKERERERERETNRSCKKSFVADLRENGHSERLGETLIQRNKLRAETQEPNATEGKDKKLKRKKKGQNVPELLDP